MELLVSSYYPQLQQGHKFLWALWNGCVILLAPHAFPYYAHKYCSMCYGMRGRSYPQEANFNYPLLNSTPSPACQSRIYVKNATFYRISADLAEPDKIQDKSEFLLHCPIFSTSRNLGQVRILSLALFYCIYVYSYSAKRMPNLAFGIFISKKAFLQINFLFHFKKLAY